jgi:capsular polysaccharide transport system permease protein
MESRNKEQPTTTALDRARLLSGALSEAAQRARFSIRSRQLSSGGFQARRGEMLVRMAVRIGFVVIVLLPVIGAAVYYGLIASDQYVSEAKFTVSGGVIPKVDRIGTFTGIPTAAIIQDTQIVANYIRTRAAVEALEHKIDLRKRYSRPEIDWLSRFNSADPIEKFVRYWSDRVSISIEMPSGIVDLKVYAFTPEDAVAISRAVLGISEDLINDLNGRMKLDAVESARQQLTRAAARLAGARTALEQARNENGLLDASKAADSLNALITESKASLLQMEQEYSTLGRYVQASAPQMRTLKTRIDGMKGQVINLESRLTNVAKESPKEQTLAMSMTKFSELNLEENIAQRIYAAAASALEMSEIVAESKMMYINTFVTPVMPEESTYPWRFVFTVLIGVGALMVWGGACAMMALVRNHMA